MPDREPQLLAEGPGIRTDVAQARSTVDTNPESSRPSGARARAKAPTFFVAGFWRRTAAALIDAGVILPVSLLMCWVAGAITGVGFPPARYRGLDFWLDLLLASDPALIGALGLTLAVAVVYLFVFQMTLGCTLGMRALKIRIIDAYGDVPSTARTAVRTLGYLAGFATLGLGFLWVGFDAEKRGVHDWISSTYVVKA